jgi:hypothetical protein
MNQSAINSIELLTCESGLIPESGAAELIHRFEVLMERRRSLRKNTPGLRSGKDSETDLPISLDQIESLIRNTDEVMYFVSSGKQEILYVSEAALEFLDLQNRAIIAGRPVQAFDWLIMNLFFPEDTVEYPIRSFYLAMQRMLALRASEGYELPNLKLRFVRKKADSRSYFNVMSIVRHIHSIDNTFLGTLINPRITAIDEAEYDRAWNLRQIISPTPQELIEELEKEVRELEIESSSE